MRFGTTPHLGFPGQTGWADEMLRHFESHGRRGRHHRHGGGFSRGERGSVKYDALEVLADGPRHGYEIMLAIEERRGFRPSPGSIYPALQMLADGDYVTSHEADGKRVYAISDSGREYLKSYRESPQGVDAAAEPTAGAELVLQGMRTLHGLKDAVKQIVRSGDMELVRRGVEILGRARRELYTLLAEEA